MGIVGKEVIKIDIISRWNKDESYDNRINIKRMGIFISSLILVGGVAIYSNIIYEVGNSYSNLFYILIIIAGLWFENLIIPTGIYCIIVYLILRHIQYGFIALDSMVTVISVFFFSCLANQISIIIRKRVKETGSERQKLNDMISSIGDGVVAIDLERRITMFNRVAETISGWDREEAIGQCVDNVFILAHENGKDKIINPFDEVLRTGKIQYLSKYAVLINKNGDMIPIEDSASPIKERNGIVTGAVLVFRDVTIKNMDRAKMEYLSYHDALTGLYNRRYFEEIMKKLDCEENYPLSLLIGDLNNLKIVNDAYGHLAGDELIKKMAEIIKRVCRKDDVAVRWGGDEFVILMTNTKKDDAEKIAERIQTACYDSELNTGELSIAFGCESKMELEEDIEQIFIVAENKMYKNKMRNAKNFNANSIDVAIGNIFGKMPSYKHARVDVMPVNTKLKKAIGI